MLFANLPNNLLDCVLGGNHSHDRAEFVDDRSHLVVPSLEFLEQFKQVLGFWHEFQVAQKGLHAKRRGGPI